jgi:hypothetical protein
MLLDRDLPTRKDFSASESIWIRIGNTRSIKPTMVSIKDIPLLHVDSKSVLLERRTEMPRGHEKCLKIQV